MFANWFPVLFCRCCCEYQVELTYVASSHLWIGFEKFSQVWAYMAAVDRSCLLRDSKKSSGFN